MIIPAGLASSNLFVGAVIISALYFSREILVPIALAVLLSFVLAPLVRFLQRLKMPRSVAILGAVTIAMTIALGLTTMVMIEVNQLANDLPRYQTTLSEKMHALRDRVGSVGILKNASKMLKDLDQELKSTDGREASTDKPALSDRAARTPIPVEVHQPDPGASEALVAMLRPLVVPFTTTGIVLIFLVFFLFQREDLRDRFIRLAGSEDLERTTAALDDAGRRLGRLFLTQLTLNAVFGTVIGVGLAIIGVPSAPLWGLLAMCLRFIPYVGAILAAGLPIALAAAVGSDWTMTFLTIALFAIIEPLTGHVVEPVVCGKSAGLSPVAIVLAASFWTWLWGPLGLLLSTPLTLCLVVLAKHVDRLQFIDVMLGDRPALTPQQAAYQRMLTGDPIEAIEEARMFLKEGTVSAYYEDILLGALRLAEADAARGRLDNERLESIHETVSEVIEDIWSHTAAKNKELDSAPAKDKVVKIDARKFGKSVFCVPGLGRLDDCAALVVADILKREGFNARISGIDTEIGNADTVCVCFIEEVSTGRAAFTARKFLRRAAGVNVIICRLGKAEGTNSAKVDEAAPQSLEEIVAEVSKSVGLRDRREQ
ncbi:MAG TPA: AI-2E family transporter [Bryobacteraceae bacterium]|nr:AI-2E family transporter [Bryobacteraceae bacterium]